MTSAKEGCNFLVMPYPPWMQRVKNKFWFNSGGHQRHPVEGVERDPQNSEKNIKSLAFAETGETTCVRQRKWTEIRMKKNQWLPAAILNFQEVRTQYSPETPKTNSVMYLRIQHGKCQNRCKHPGWGDQFPRLHWLPWPGLHCLPQDPAQVGLPES